MVSGDEANHALCSNVCGYHFCQLGFLWFLPILFRSDHVVPSHGDKLYITDTWQKTVNRHVMMASALFVHVHVHVIHFHTKYAETKHPSVLVCMFDRHFIDNEGAEECAGVSSGDNNVSWFVG